MQIEKSFRPKIDAYKSLDASGGGVFRNTHPLPQVVLTAPPRQLRRSRAHRCVRTASGSDPIKAQLVCMIPSLPLRVLTRRPRSFD